MTILVLAFGLCIPSLVGTASNAYWKYASPTFHDPYRSWRDVWVAEYMVWLSVLSVIAPVTTALATPLVISLRRLTGCGRGVQIAAYLALSAAVLGHAWFFLLVIPESVCVAC